MMRRKLRAIGLLSTIILLLVATLEPTIAQNSSEKLTAVNGLYLLDDHNNIEIEITRLDTTLSKGASLGYYIASKSGRPVAGKVIWSDVASARTTRVRVDLDRNPDAELLGFFLIPDRDGEPNDLNDLEPVTFGLFGGGWLVSGPGGSVQGRRAATQFTDANLNVDRRRQASIDTSDSTMIWTSETRADPSIAVTLKTLVKVVGQAAPSLDIVSDQPLQIGLPLEDATSGSENAAGSDELAFRDISVPNNAFFYDIGGAAQIIIDLDAYPSDTAFHNSFGYFLTNEDGQPYRGQVIWADVSEAKSERIAISRRALGRSIGLGFFIIPDGATLNPDLEDKTPVGLARYNGEWTVVRDGSSLNGQSLPAFLSALRWNADGVDHVADSPAPGNMNWEDEYRGGNGSYDDVNIDLSVTIEVPVDEEISATNSPVNVPVIPPPPAPLSVAEVGQSGKGGDKNTVATTETSVVAEESSPKTDSPLDPISDPSLNPSETQSITSLDSAPPPDGLRDGPDSQNDGRPFWGEPTVSGFGEVELSHFPYEPLFATQSGEQFQQSFAGSTLYAQNVGSTGEVLLELFGRYDQTDRQRSFIDIQRAHLDRYSDTFSLTAGVLTESWGVLELENIVDIINQRNIAEDFRADRKLGQPGIKLGLPVLSFGEAELYYLPFPRKRPFPGSEGRFQLALPVDDDDAFYESAANGDRERFGEQVAARFESFLGDLEAAVTHFYGTSRDPSFNVILDDATPVALRPAYDQINQTGVELRTVALGNIFKAEAFRRADRDPLDERNAFYGAAAGIEREFVRIVDSDAALTLFGEYYFDNRSRVNDEVAPSPLDNDVFLGGRLAFNDLADTQALLTSTIDIASQSTIMALELQRRFGTQLQVKLKGEAFIDANEDPALATFQDDHRISLRVRYYF